MCVVISNFHYIYNNVIAVHTYIYNIYVCMANVIVLAIYVYMNKLRR